MPQPQPPVAFGFSKVKPDPSSATAQIVVYVSVSNVTIDGFTVDGNNTSITSGVTINGVDIVGWNADGRITRFKVMVRPLKAVNMLHQMMAAQLAAPVG